jgi:hypothetical protein
MAGATLAGPDTTAEAMAATGPTIRATDDGGMNAMAVDWHRNPDPLPGRVTGWTPIGTRAA